MLDIACLPACLLPLPSPLPVGAQSALQRQDGAQGLHGQRWHDWSRCAQLPLQLLPAQRLPARQPANLCRAGAYLLMLFSLARSFRRPVLGMLAPHSALACFQLPCVPACLPDDLPDYLPGYLPGYLPAGGVQWMTAGRGVIHSEMPVVTSGDLHGFQLWINLPAKVSEDPSPAVPGAGCVLPAGRLPG